MAIDLQAIGGMYAAENERRDKKKQDTINVIKEIVEKNNLANKNVTATQAAEVDTYLKNLNYSSTDEEIGYANDMLNAWFISADSRERNPGDRKVNKAIYEAKGRLIANISKNQDEYINLNDKIDNLELQLDELQTSDDNKYDFTEIGKVLKDYKDTGENVLKYNQNWVGKKEYTDNIEEISTWITQGKKMQAMDVSDEEGLQLAEEYTNQPYYGTLMDEAYNQWKLGDTVLAGNAMSLAMKYMVEGQRNIDASKAELAKNENELFYNTTIPNMTSAEVSNVNKFSSELLKQLSNPEYEPVVPRNMSSAHQEITRRLTFGAKAYPKISEAFANRENEIEEGLLVSEEEGITNALSLIDDSMAELEIDPELRKLLKSTKSYSNKEKLYRENDVRKDAAIGVGSNIEETFKYLDDMFYGEDFEDTAAQDGAVAALVKGTLIEGSVEWYTVMDEILDLYYPKTETGLRAENQDIRDWMVQEWGGDDQEFGESGKEINGWNLFIKHLKAYDEIRQLDRYLASIGEKGADPRNPLNLPGMD